MAAHLISLITTYLNLVVVSKMKICFCTNNSLQQTHECTMKWLSAVRAYCFIEQAYSCLLLTNSLFLRASLSGVCRPGRHTRRGLPPSRHLVVQALQEEETGTAGGERGGGSSQRKKRPHCVVRPRDRQRERKRGIERGTEESRTSSLALRLTLGIGACGAPLLGPGAFFPTGHFTSTFPFNHSLWIPDVDQFDGQLLLTRDKLRMYLCVERCYRTLDRLLCIFYITMCLSFLERNNCVISSSFPVQLNGLPNTFPV